MQSVHEECKSAFLEDGVNAGTAGEPNGEVTILVEPEQRTGRTQSNGKRMSAGSPQLLARHAEMGRERIWDDATSRAPATCTPVRRAFVGPADANLTLVRSTANANNTCEPMTDKDPIARHENRRLRINRNIDCLNFLLVHRAHGHNNREKIAACLGFTV
mmetsp:Transcript_85213/g.237917  ORF Transcript_85213/g.237917 Transcript_85213/m.237917 type:complete len:160 (-) Transcript_85213:583-1062(-)